MLYIVLAIIIAPMIIFFIKHFIIGIKKSWEIPFPKPIVPYPDIYGVEKKRRLVRRLLGPILTHKHNGH